MSKTPAPPEAKLTPFRNVEWRPAVALLMMEWYGRGLASPRLPAEMDDAEVIVSYFLFHFFKRRQLS
jgi:hypothetical protein